MTALKDDHQRSAQRWRCAAIILMVCCLGLLVAVLCLVLLKDRAPDKQLNVPDCGADFKDRDIIDASEANDPGLFDDLTVAELKALQGFLYSSKSGLNLVRPSKAAVTNSYVHISDLHPPMKSQALDYLVGKGPKPARNARVVIFRGDLPEPVVEEYVVGPLPNPTKCELLNFEGVKNPVSFPLRPMGDAEFRGMFEHLIPLIDEKIGFILKESYNATFTNCDKCLDALTHPVGSGTLGSKVRKLWLTVTHAVEFYTVNPTDLIILLNLNSTNTSQYFVEKLVYGSQEFRDLDEMAEQYRAGSVKKSRIPFPTNLKDYITTMHLRGDPVPRNKKRAPRTYEPDGKRYTVKHRHVEYMQWSFDFRMSTMRGPQLYDVKFNNERIAYDLGLQEIAVFYASNNSAMRSSDYIDSGALMGASAQSLVPGADCPETSTFFNLSFLSETSDEPMVHQQVFCLFEQNQGIPLRRHLTYKSFYSGVEDITLILRSIMTLGNYDYIIDYIFHQSGALEVRALSTGYLATSFYTTEEDSYGFKLTDTILGNIHHHMFFFKADLDINGRSNRYETLDISSEAVQNSQTTNDPDSEYHQIKFKRNLRNREMDAAYKFKFDEPKYHLIHNEQAKNDHGVMRAYRIGLNGMTKQLLPEDSGNEINAGWARNQLTVTKYKDHERDGASIYGMFDSLEPTVNFTEFYADDDNIVDEDLVAWISIGVHHIPHTEDLPVTPTPGCHLGFVILPYNYFHECPSSQSRDAIRVEYKDSNRPKQGVRVVRYGNPEEPRCVPRSVNYDKQVEADPSIVLDT